MPWQTEIRCVLFDLGGTLFRHLPRESTEQNLRGIVEAATATPLSAQQLQRYHQIRQETEASFVARPFFLHQALVKASFQRFAHEVSLPVALQRPLAEAFYTAQRETVTHSLQLRDDTAAVLAQLQQRKRQTAIVSNIDDDYLHPLLQRVSVLDGVAFVLSSEAARSCKPDPSIYHQALRLCAEPPERVLFVGDSLTNDVFGPAQVGMRTCWMAADQQRDHPDAAKADLLIQSLSELPAALGC
ncbi:MAG: HAD family hydrolase [Pseudomonadales bacterium]